MCVSSRVRPCSSPVTVAPPHFHLCPGASFLSGNTRSCSSLLPPLEGPGPDGHACLVPYHAAPQPLTAGPDGVCVWGGAGSVRGRHWGLCDGGRRGSRSEAGACLSGSKVGTPCNPLERFWEKPQAVEALEVIWSEGHPLRGL